MDVSVIHSDTTRQYKLNRTISDDILMNDFQHTDNITIQEEGGL